MRTYPRPPSSPLRARAALVDLANRVLLRFEVYRYVIHALEEAAIEDPVVARKILDSLGLPSRPPPMVPARLNPQPNLNEF